MTRIGQTPPPLPMQGQRHWHANIAGRRHPARMKQSAPSNSHLAYRIALSITITFAHRTRLSVYRTRKETGRRGERVKQRHILDA